MNLNWVVSTILDSDVILRQQIVFVYYHFGNWSHLRWRLEHTDKIKYF